MELREWAIRLLSADRIEDKLFDPIVLSDRDPGTALRWQEPTRPMGMGFNRHAGKKDRLPSFQEHRKQENITICLHRFAGHELLAVEMMAFALLAFPEAPRAFRMGVANTLREEQGHVRLYMDRLSALGLPFGDLPLYKHFWSYTPYLLTPLHYISVMALTFEMANLDFAPQYGLSFERNGDLASAALMDQIFQDEISHVSFGCSWFRKFNSEKEDSWELYLKSIPPHLNPSRGRGFIFQDEPRRLAGIPTPWIEALSQL